MDDDFQRLTDPYRRELTVHCYRMLGSLEDAEDALQETLLRAWRRLDTLQTRSSLRAWLYRIATNVCLDLLGQRKARSLPNLLFEAADPQNSLPAPIDGPLWLDPLPDRYLAAPGPDPAARYEVLESVTLAFLTALQQLPPRQRAVLILRDVLGWHAHEAAQLLDLTQAAANSALQRARATMKRLNRAQSFATTVRTDDARTASLLERYVRAWETADAAGLVALLREDATLTMPPAPAWYRGREAIGAFYAGQLFAGQAQGRNRLLATRANGCPAYAVYQRGDDGVFRPAALQLLGIAGGQIGRVDTWPLMDERLLARFGLPKVLSDR
jgi:RNA polymerase sigma-70 factor (ECF subfamily)